MTHKMKWIATDGWRGYEQPIDAVAGSSDTGEWSDSPAPSHIVTKELRGLQTYLKEHGMASKIVSSRSGNGFMSKRWVVPARADDFSKAKLFATKYLKAHDKDTSFIHSSD